MSLKLVSLFSGGGGLDLGLEAAGFSTIYATDIDVHSCQTLRNGQAYAVQNDLPFLKNAHIEQADITQVSAESILKDVGMQRGELDMLAGGPPCQSFSVAGKRLGVCDTRGQLYQDYVRILSGLQPKAFIFENVAGLLTIDNGDVFNAICAGLENPCDDTQYRLTVLRIDAADYAVPQHRERVLIIGHRVVKDVQCVPSKEIRCVPSTPNADSQRTVTDALSGLPAAGAYPANHQIRAHGDVVKQRIALLKHGERDALMRVNRLHPDKPSYTVLAGSSQGGGKTHVHPFEDRQLTPRESARIQTFPDWWSFSGKTRHAIKQAGNAVPPLLAAAVGRAIIHQVFNKQPRSMVDIITLLSQEHLFYRAAANSQSGSIQSLKSK